MKQRNGFVSNSSSSSFVVFGKQFSQEEFMNKYGLTDEEMDSINENGVEDSSAWKRIKKEFTLVWPHYYDGDWIVGGSISGDHTNIVDTMLEVESVLGEGCELFTGVDYDGELSLD